MLYGKNAICREEEKFTERRERMKCGKRLKGWGKGDVQRMKNQVHCSTFPQSSPSDTGAAGTEP